ncbi:Multidrug export protein MepA [BD1-7 clade bacterium]|uniref:Multidrug-efflux transporter n=1 Tax=BD1-7 clade bacterium TaxID=2029982 RepID=A0A5S9QEJ0_9GAMM|nr:Multidrug export protein MepA [BD1-7 clade bacterium]CAA0116893.1 Multidrug export protein MepA [BD1-7 clade bacterium]
MVAARLTEGSIPRSLATMALPMIVGLLANMSIQAVDIWFISRLGPEPLAAMGYVFPVTMVFLSISIGLSAGAASAIARRIGHGHKGTDIRRLVTDTQWLAVLVAIVTACIGWLTIDPVFRSLGASDLLMPLIRQYVEIFYFNGALTLVGMVGLSTVRATGNTKAQGMAMLIGAIINAILDPLLIFGLFGFPQLGIQGAALASTAARLFSLGVAWHILVNRMDLLIWGRVKFSQMWASWKTIFAVGLPAVGTNIIIPLSASIITALLASYGDEAVAGMGVASRIEPLMLICFYALSSVIGPFVGQNLTALRADRVRRGVVVAALFCLSYGTLLTLFLWFFAAPIVSWFSDQQEVIQVARDYLWIVPISYGCSGVVMCVNASFNGMGKPIPATVISALRVIVLYLPLAFLGSSVYGVKGIFIAYTGVNILTAIIAWLWFERFITRHSIRVEKTTLARESKNSR